MRARHAAYIFACYYFKFLSPEAPLTHVCKYAFSAGTVLDTSSFCPVLVALFTTDVQDAMPWVEQPHCFHC